MAIMNGYAIIPLPASIQYRQGNFRCSGLPLADAGTPFRSEARIFAGQLEQTWGKKALLCDNSILKLENNEGINGKESYRLEITPDRICVSAGTQQGIYRGLQTLRQLALSGYHDGVLSIPCGIIEDKPRFPWRGFMLDCSRHFYSVAFIKKLLDALSLQHINMFHWHLTDDQGWRFPVRAYPLLAEIGSKRKEHCLGGAVTGGFYTEEQIRDIVQFAAARHIETVPEVDLPGHTSAVLAAYPGLGCTGGPYRVEDRYGIFNDVLCAGNNDIFPLIEAIFDALGELFPSRYVHIGGDEVRFKNWTHCPKCRRRMAELKLESVGQLQNWITVRLAHMLGDRGKTAIGWDETLEHAEKFSLPENLVVMSWRGFEGGNAAVSQGRRVIMAPLSNGCYLDYRHADDPEEPGRLGISTIAQAYDMDPVTPEMDAAAASLVLGGQGNLWSEIIYAGKIAEYMIFPRICAIAESLWSQREAKDIEDFNKRLAVHQCRLDKLELLQYRQQ